MDNKITRMLLGDDSITIMFEQDVSMMDVSTILHALADEYRLGHTVKLSRANVRRTPNPGKDEE